MAKMNRGNSGTPVPTMIIPSGTSIETDEHGQLSISTPGNLVLQNSGTYGHLESTGGSIRVEANVQVEAVSIRCAESCFVQGSLTAWKVIAKEIHLESSARAHIVLQETESLQIGKDARMVGNFDSEKELFLLFSRFADQFRGMPFSFQGKEKTVKELPGPSEPPVIQVQTEEEFIEEKEEMASAADELPDGLFFALVMLQRDLGNSTHGPTSQKVIEELVGLLRNREIETIQSTFQVMFSRIVEPSVDVTRAQELIVRYFEETA